MKMIRTIFLIVLFPLSVVGQELRIEGKVLDSRTQEPVIGATVSLSSGRAGVVTDIDGAFSFVIASLPTTVAVNYLGYKKQEIEVYDASEPVVILLVENPNILDEIIITGYTSQQRKAISGAVTSINVSESLANLPEPDVAKLLQGKASGVNIVATNGQPGGGVTFLVRGSNSINGSVEPLYVVDGVFITNNVPVSGGGGNLLSNALADLNPSDIENIAILKDANATAIYGSQGANGVVVITTKRGKFNEKSRINATVSHGWSDAAKKFRAATGPETALLFNESWTNTEQDYLAHGETPVHRWDYVPNAESLPTYDRIGDLFRTAQSSEYQVSVQGGNANSAHYVGFGYTSQEAIVKPSYFTRFSGRINYDNQVNSKLKVGTSLSLARTYRKVSSSDNDPGGVINSAIFPRSYLPIYNEDGSYARHATFDNHQALIDHLNNNAITWRTIANLFAEYSFLPELKFRSSWSLDYNNNDQKNFLDSQIGSGRTNNGYATASNTTYAIYSAEQLLTYVKAFDRHALNLFVGNTVKAEDSHQAYATGRNFATDVVTEVPGGAVTTGSSATQQARLVSFFGKAGYTYQDKYTIEGNIRADGSSRFGANVRWGYFPSAGFTWNAGQEDFIRNLNIFDALKLRGSYGLSGNQNGIGNYDALGVWNATASYLDTPGTYPARLANPDLTWETTRQTDIGLEFSILGSRLNIGFDWYRKYTYDMLLDVPVPTRSGFTSYLQNYGEISNTGVELSLNSVNIETKDFGWTTDFNISHNKNVIEKIPQEISLGASGRNTSILRQGYSVNSFYLFKQLYVDTQTGNAVYEDINGDGVLTDADRQVVGSALPLFTAGLTNHFNYRSWDLGFFFYGSYGNKIMNMLDYFLVHGGAYPGDGFIPRQLERWQKPGDVTDIPRMTDYNGDANANGGSANNYRGIVNDRSTRYLEDASYLRLKDVSLSYTVPRAVSSRFKAERLKFTLTGTNLLTLTKYGGLDPEVSAQSSNKNTAGYDWATVPQPRTVQFIINLTL